MAARRCGCPECVARAAVLLLESGRTGMALRLLRDLPAAIAEAKAAARDAGVRDGGRTRPTVPRSPVTAPSREGAMRRKPAPVATRPGFPREAAALRQEVARLGAERVAELLALRLSDLGPLLEGRVALAWSSLRRLRRAG